MKKILIHTIQLLFIAVISSCSDISIPVDNNPETGYMSLKSITVDDSETEIVSTPLSRGSINTDDFIIEIFSEGNLVRSLGYYSTLPSTIELAPGKYTLVARNGDNTSAAFNTPYYEGRCGLEIFNNMITEVESVDCYLSNIKVTINISPKLRALLGRATTVSVGYEDQAELTFTISRLDNGDEAYFVADDSEEYLKVTFSGSIDGDEVSVVSYCYDLKKGQHRIINYTLKDENGLDEFYAGDIDINGHLGIIQKIDGER